MLVFLQVGGQIDPSLGHIEHDQLVAGVLNVLADNQASSGVSAVSGRQLFCCHFPAPVHTQPLYVLQRGATDDRSSVFYRSSGVSLLVPALEQTLNSAATCQSKHHPAGRYNLPLIASAFSLSRAPPSS